MGPMLYRFTPLQSDKNTTMSTQLLYRFTPLQSDKNTTMSTQQGTNTQTPESSGATGVEFSGNGGTTKYVFYGLLALLGLVIALSIWRRGKK